MARKATTTKAKSKTAKTKSASSSANKVTKSTVSTKTSTVNVYGLRQLQIMSFGVFGVLAVLTVLFMNTTSYQVVISHLTQDSLTNTISPAVHHAMYLELRWLVVATLVISMILPLLYVTRFEKRYKLGLQNKLVPWRWLDLAVCGALIVETTALLSGLNDVLALKLVGTTAVFVAIFSWLAERENMNTTKPVWVNAWAGVLAKATIVVVLAMSTSATVIYGSIRGSWYVYALYGVLAFGMIMYTVHHFRQLQGQDYVKTERNYVITNLLAKTAFALILITAFMQ